MGKRFHGFHSDCEACQKKSKQYVFFLSPSCVSQGYVVLCEAHVLTDGLAGAESRMIDIVGLRQKSVRERGFPTSILEQGLEVKIEEASATEQEDKVRILNSIAFPRLNTQELKDSQSNPLAHPNYERVDKALASHFALASWRGFVLQGKQTEALARALRLDDGRKVVQLSFTGCQHFSDSELKRLLENLPGDLDLGFSALETWDCVKTDRFPFAKSLDQLELRFTGSSSFRSAAGLADLLREMENLVDLELWFMNLPGLEELGSLNAAFLSLRNLENLVDLSGCGQVSEVRTELHQSIRSLKRRGSSLDLWINIEGLPSRRCGLRFCPRSFQWLYFRCLRVIWWLQQVGVGLTRLRFTRVTPQLRRSFESIW
ncbi:unnamed protein product [Durusdinium trenchii]|uniref:Uncharacterized protein n=1 Tax=Durusdinium trenchii TaxID=1381693 RepID=A0ABP0JSD2_9DINO